MREKIINIIQKNPGLRARYIASMLGTDRRTVNQIIYREVNITFYQDQNYGWHLKTPKIPSNPRNPNNPITSGNPVVEWKSARQYMERFMEIINLVAENFPDEHEIQTDKGEIDTTTSFIELAEESLMKFCLDILVFSNDNELDIGLIDKLNGIFSGLIVNRVPEDWYYDEYDGFETAYDSIPAFIDVCIKYDNFYLSNTSEFIMLIFKKIGFEFMSKLNINESDLDIDDRLSLIKDYLKSFNFYYLLFPSKVTSCVNCYKLVIKNEEHLFEGDYYCDECLDDDEYDEDEDYEDDEEDDSDEDSDENDEEVDDEDEDEDEDDEKKEIQENCTTCLFRSSCANSRRNQLCSKYKYAK